MINKTSVFLMMFILISFPSFCMEASPILGYQSAQKHSDNYHYVMLKYARTHEVLPMLRNICRDCDWVIDHTRQSVGLMVKKSEWDVYKKALLALDKRRPMIRIDVAVVEVSNIQSERYRQLLSHLTKPTKLTTSIEGVIELMISSGNATLVSSPRLIGKSGSSVKLKVGDQMPYKTAIQNATSIQTNVQYIHSGIELKITPYLHYDHLIDLDVELHYSAMRGMQQEGGGYANDCVKDIGVKFVSAPKFHSNFRGFIG